MSEFISAEQFVSWLKARDDNWRAQTCSPKYCPLALATGYSITPEYYRDPLSAKLGREIYPLPEWAARFVYVVDDVADLETRVTRRECLDFMSQILGVPV